MECRSSSERSSGSAIVSSDTNRGFQFGQITTGNGGSSCTFTSGGKSFNLPPGRYDHLTTDGKLVNYNNNTYSFGTSSSAESSNFNHQDAPSSAGSTNGQRFKDTTLSGRNLPDGAEIKDCTLKGCNGRRLTLKDCSFSGCNFSNSYLKDCSFKGSNIRDSRLNDCSFSASNVNGGSLTDCSHSRSVVR